MANGDYMFIDEATGKEINPNYLNSSHSPYGITKSDKADLLDKIKPDAIVEVIRHKLMGQHLKNGVWEYVPALKKKAISELGAWDISNLMLSVSSQNVSLSKLKDNEIRARTLEIIDTVHDMILKNWEDYGITGTDQIAFVHQIVMSNTLITLKQSENAGIRALIGNTTTESRIVNTNEIPQKRGWFGLRGR